MATKTANEAKPGVVSDIPAGVAMTRTDTRMQMREIDVSAAGIGPESLAHLLSEGYETQKHCKLTEGTYIRGIFVGMEDGELRARADDERPQVKWVYLKVSDVETVRLLGAYNMVSQLEHAPHGAPVVIARGIDYKLPNGYPCTDYYVYINRKGVKLPEPTEVSGQRVA